MLVRVGCLSGYRVLFLSGRVRRVFRIGVALLLLTGVLCGCVHAPRVTSRKGKTTNSDVLQNPVLVRANNDNDCWERTVDLLHDYFEIANENRLDGVIETRPKVGASLLEPWHKDSPGLKNRLESTLQSIRRRAFVSVTSTPEGYLVGVEVFKEVEDVPGAQGNSAGSATFLENRPLQRDLRTLVGESAADGWLSLGRDTRLEQRILVDLHREFGRKASE